MQIHCNFLSKSHRSAFGVIMELCQHIHSSKLSLFSIYVQLTMKKHGITFLNSVLCL